MKEINTYFDYNATKPTDQRVVKAMLPYFNTNFGNPSSHHFFGEKAEEAVEQSRKLISDVLNTETSKIIFTSDATEAINLALMGIAETNYYKGKPVITTQTEQRAVLNVCKYLEKKGFEIDYLQVNNDGLIDINEFEDKIREDTILVSIICVDNETVDVKPIEEIGEICKRHNVFFFTDATQLAGKTLIDANKLNIDLLCFSVHKSYGPKGIGGLYCRNGLNIETLIHGGGHERELRSGTLTVPGIVGLAKAFKIVHSEMSLTQEKIKTFKKYI